MRKRKKYAGIIYRVGLFDWRIKGAAWMFTSKRQAIKYYENEVLGRAYYGNI